MSARLVTEAVNVPAFHIRNLPSGAVRGVRGVRRAGRASATCTGLVSRQLAWRSQAESCHARGVLRRHLAPPLQTRHLCRAIAEGSNDKDQSTGEFFMEIEFDNESDDTGTVVKIKAANQDNFLASVATAFNSMGMVVMNASISTERETGRVMDVFCITDLHGSKVAEAEFDTLREFIRQTCLQSSSSPSKSAPPAIYGIAAAAEARWLRTTKDSANGDGAEGGKAAASGAPSGGQGASPAREGDSSLLNAEEAAARGEAAAALELAAAEMAQAAASLVTVERMAAELANQAIANPDDDTLLGRLNMQEEARVEASAVLERRMAAMEAALASRRQLKEALRAVRRRPCPDGPQCRDSTLACLELPPCKSHSWTPGLSRQYCAARSVLHVMFTTALSSATHDLEAELLPAQWSDDGEAEGMGARGRRVVVGLALSRLQGDAGHTLSAKMWKLTTSRLISACGWTAATRLWRT